MFCQCLMRSAERSIALLSCAVLIGCVPISSTFYRPTATAGGKVTNYQCDGSGGQPNSMSIWRGGVKLLVSVFSRQPHEAVLWIFVPSGSVVQLDAADVRAVDGSGSAVGKIEVIMARDWGEEGANEDIPLALPIQSFNGELYTSDKNPVAWYHIWLSLKEPVPKVFYIEVPEMTINGTGYLPLRVKFERKHEMYLQPLNGC